MEQNLKQLLGDYDIPQPAGKAVSGIDTIYVPMENDHHLGCRQGYTPSWCDTPAQAARLVQWRIAELQGKDSSDYWVLAIERTYRDGMQVAQRHYRLADDGRQDAIRDVAGVGKAIQAKYPHPMRLVGGQLLDRRSDAEITAQTNRGAIIRIIPDEHDREEAGGVFGGNYVEGYLLADGRIIFAGSYVREALDAALDLASIARWERLDALYGHIQQNKSVDTFLVAWHHRGRDRQCAARQTGPEGE